MHVLFVLDVHTETECDLFLFSTVSGEVKIPDFGSELLFFKLFDVFTAVDN